MYKGYNTYKERDAILVEMGFKDYNDYLLSPLWSDIKTKALNTLGRKCSICSKHTYLIHHRNYTKENLTGTTFEWLTPICDKCHGAIEFNHRGRKRSTLDQVDRAYLQLCDKSNGTLKVPIDQRKLDKQQRRKDKRLRARQQSENYAIGKFLREQYPQQFKMVLQKMKQVLPATVVKETKAQKFERIFAK